VAWSFVKAGMLFRTLIDGHVACSFVKAGTLFCTLIDGHVAGSFVKAGMLFRTLIDELIVVIVLNNYRFVCMLLIMYFLWKPQSNVTK